MSALHNPISPPPVKHSHRTARNRYFEFLEFCRAVVGLPTLVAMILSFFHRSELIVQGGTGAALLIAIFLRFFPKLKPWTVLPLLLSAVLAVVFILFVAPNRAHKQSARLARLWPEWTQSLEDAADKCSSKFDKKGKVITVTPEGCQCLNQELTHVLKERPRPEQESEVTALASDVMAGQLMLADDTLKAVLDDRLGVRGKFLGTGRSQPVGGRDYQDASARGYMVPNLSDKNAEVWVWKADDQQSQKQIMKQNLLDFLKKPNLPAKSDHPAVKDSLDRLQHNVTSHDPTPILVRFALIDQDKPYSGCLGRSTATRVHMHNLDDLKDTTVGDAARSTGWSEPEKLGEPGQRLFIWVYAPDDGSKAVAATWGTVLDNFGKWITDDPCKKPN